MARITKDEYYLGIALAVSKRSTCLKRHYGCVIVKDDIIIATGYNGSPRGEENCCDRGTCKRANAERYSNYESCDSVHAEQNAIISAPRKDMIGATLYMVGKDSKTGEYVENSSSCSMCKRVVINSGITKVIVRDSKDKYREIDVQDWINDDESLDGKLGY